MEKRIGILVLTGVAVAWLGTARGELSMGWTSEKKGVAKASVACRQTLDEGADGEKAEERITREAYLAVARAVAEEAAVNELSLRMVDRLFGGADDGNATGYGESTLPGGSDGTARVEGMVGMRGTAGRAARGVFRAEDDAGNYEANASWIGVEPGKGSGFEGGWHLGNDSASPARQSVNSTEASGAEGSFYMQAGADRADFSVVRELGTDVGLERGTFSVTGYGVVDEPGDFAGFAVYGADEKELFSWGVSWRMVEMGGGNVAINAFVYRLGGSGEYRLVNGNGSSGGYVDYTLTWAQLGGRMEFTLTAGSAGGAWTYIGEDEFKVSLGTTERVMAIGVLLSEGGVAAGNGDGSEMAFDKVSVTGVEPAVPEPGVLGLLAAGAAALAGRRKRGMHNA